MLLGCRALWYLTWLLSIRHLWIMSLRPHYSNIDFTMIRQLYKTFFWVATWVCLFVGGFGFFFTNPTDVTSLKRTFKDFKCPTVVGKFICIVMFFVVCFCDHPSWIAMGCTMATCFAGLCNQFWKQFWSSVDPVWHLDETLCFRVAYIDYKDGFKGGLFHEFSFMPTLYYQFKDV